MIKLTDEDGDEIWVNKDRIIWLIRYDDNTTLIQFEGQEVYVKEPVDVILS